MSDDILPFTYDTCDELSEGRVMYWNVTFKREFGHFMEGEELDKVIVDWHLLTLSEDAPCGRELRLKLEPL